MTTPCLSLRLLALAAGVVVAASCDTRLPTAPSQLDDVTRPAVSFSVPGSINNAVGTGAPVTVTVTATDDKGVASVRTTVRNGATILVTDTAAFRPTQLSTTRSLVVPAATLRAGDRIVVRTTVSDAALNTTTDSTIIFVAQPTITIVSPVRGARINVGDSLFVRAVVRDTAGIASVSFAAYTLRGSAELGTRDSTFRYTAVSVPLAAPTGRAVRDTTITRYLRVATPADTAVGQLVVSATVTDVLGAVSRDTATVFLVKGPSVQVSLPDSADRASLLTVKVVATDPTGVARLGFSVRSGTNPAFPTPVSLDTVAPCAAISPCTFTASIPIPGDAPAKGVLTIVPISRNVGGQDGASSPVSIAVRAGLAPAPLVYQQIAGRVETKDSLRIIASGNGIVSLGYVLRDLLDTTRIVRQGTITLPAPVSSVDTTIALGLAKTDQGRRVYLVSTATDKAGRVGYSTTFGSGTIQASPTSARKDTSLVVYGTTFALPTNRNGTIADLVVDQARGNVFLSNINFGRLELWRGGNFDPAGIVVGSQPWGMTMSRTAAAKDTLYVANSGGTNMSRVFIGATTASAMREDLANRILTRVSFLYKVSEVRDESTGRIRITVQGPFLFSDRPQYVQQSASGRLYFSTKPTVAAPKGTVRYMDPAAAAPDARFILDFATAGTDPNSYLIGNVDSASAIPAPANSTENDALVLCDHPSGTTQLGSCASTKNGIGATISALRAAVPTTDIDAQVNKDENSIGLTDTTYAAASGNGQWITFGEGNRTPTARNFLLNDDGSVPGRFTYASPAINVADLINNASDRIFGVALDRSGKTLGIHGGETYFATTNIPFTQRLQGKKSTFNVGAGIAFHPNADGVTSPQDVRLAFVSSNNGSVEAVDIAYYDFTRGSLATKFNLYGPLRASLPFAGDDASVILKLFGLSPQGLVVIDVTAGDLIAGP